MPSWAAQNWQQVYPKPFYLTIDTQTSRNRDLSLRYDSSAVILTIQGCAVGRVRATTALRTDDTNTVEDEYFTIREAWDLLTCQARDFPTHVSMVKDYVWTLTAGQMGSSGISTGTGRQADNKHLLDFAAYQISKVLGAITNDCQVSVQTCQRFWLELARRAMDVYEALTPDWETTIKNYSSESIEWIRKTMCYFHPRDEHVADAAASVWESLPSQSGSGRAFHEISVQTTHVRKFFVMEKANMGLGPGATLPGDIVCILFGGSTPYVLRPIPHTDEHLFVGECYIHGLMDGEAIDMLERGELDRQWFNLR